MTLLGICVKIFFARILDVSIATFRQTVMIRGKIIISCILAFFEVFIWFIIAREALRMDISSILIPIFYSLGYATGTLLGFFLARVFINGVVGIQVIINATDVNLVKALKLRGYEVCMFHLENDFKGNDKKMLFLEVNNKSLKKIENLILKIAPSAFIIVNDSRKVMNGIIK